MADTQWLSEDERTAWIRLAAVLELLPGALDAQLTRDVHLTHFEYFVLAMLSEAPLRTLRVTGLAAQTNASLPRLSRVLTGLEKKGLVERTECSRDRRVKNVTLTEQGWRKVLQAAPGHVTNVRNLVLDQLTSEQVSQLSTIAAQLLKRLDPDARMFVSALP